MSDATEQPTRILVVDDEEIVFSLIRDALEDEGFVVETASNGPDALAIIEKTDLDLVITDIRMPGMSGIEMIAKARELRPDIGVIFMTGYADLTSAKDAIKQGAYDYMMKPFELSEMRQAVHNAIRIKRETEEQSSDRQLSHLSDLNQMLFATGDRKSLIISSLKFAMMHQHASDGAAIYFDRDAGDFIMITVRGDRITEQQMPREPLSGALENIDPDEFRQPFVITSPEEHPIYRRHPQGSLGKYLFPNWWTMEHHMIIVPVWRSEIRFGWMMIKFEEDTVRLKEADMKFLSIAASQLAITLENLSLLEETQKAYSRLKELQDETIELEKMATRGQISAEIGHELNNFVGVVAGNLSLLDVHLKKGAYDQMEKYVAAMLDTITKIKAFTSNLMDLSPISSTREMLAIDKVIEEVIEYLKPQRRYRDVSISIESMADEVHFEADATQIQQLLYNLFNNAADATVGCKRRDIRVRVDQSFERGTFTLTIRDSGNGIDPELLKKAFRERFSTKETGHGFGLVVCNRIIENHDGKLHIESAPGEGTAISVEFPMAEVTEPATV